MKLVIPLVFCLALSAAGETKLGQPLTLKKAVAVDQVASKPQNYVGKVVQVKGQITEVCQKMGCWINIADPKTGKMIRLKVDDGVIVFPQDSIGSMVVAEGKVVKIEAAAPAAPKADAHAHAAAPAAAAAAHDHSAHGDHGEGHACSMHAKPAAKVTYQIQGTGAVILD